MIPISLPDPSIFDHIYDELESSEDEDD